MSAAVVVPGLEAELRELGEMAAGFARARLGEVVVAAEGSDSPSAEWLARPAEQGFWTLGAAESYGGGGADLPALAVAVSGVATAAPAVAAAMAAVHGALHTVAGDAVAPLVGMAAEGSLPVPVDAAGPYTSLRVTSSGDGVRVDGVAPRVEGAAQAGAFVVQDPQAGAVVVAPEHVRLGPPLRRTGLRGWTPCSVTFSSTPGTAYPAEPERGRRTRALLLGAAAAGVAGAAAEAAAEYITTRHQFGAPLAALPAVAALAASTTSDATACATEIMSCTRSNADPTPVALRCARLAVSVTERAIQLHGGYGYLTEYPVERAFRDAVTLRALITATL